VLLCQPFWMWGGEMGANECNVVIGNEAVWTSEPTEETGLLGMDLLRLGLERGGTAEEALKVITELLETHGQGGSCSETGKWYYHNSFLICDPSEVWVLETAGRHWVAERKTSGYRNISNGLTIHGGFERSFKGLQAHVESQGSAKKDSEGKLDFCRSFATSDTLTGDDDDGRFGRVKKLLCQRIKNAADDGTATEDNKNWSSREHKGDGFLTPEAAKEVLRDEEINMTGAFTTTCSMISILPTQEDMKRGTQRVALHLVTGTPDATFGLYKPFILGRATKVSERQGGTFRTYVSLNDD